MNHDVKEKDMDTMIQGIKKFVREEDGAAGIEYALLLAFVALVMVGFGKTVSDAVSAIWSKISSSLTEAAPAAASS